MNESSQQRLDEFRAAYKNARPAAAGFVAWLQILVILVGFAGIVAILLLRGTSGLLAGDGLAPEAQRQLAAYLAEKKAYAPALDAYDRYLAQAPIAPADRAKVCFAAAKVAMDGEQYERALALLYQAEWLKPAADLQKEIDAKVMACLELLGRATELRTELRERAQIGRAANEVKPDDVVLADLGDRMLTERDLDEALDKLPPAAREAMAAPEKKTELLKNMVAEYLLAEKARRQGLDKDPELQAMLSDQLDALMVRKLLHDEVQSKIQVTPQDVERFYKSEEARFVTAPSATVKMAKRPVGAMDEWVFADPPVAVHAGQPAAVAGGQAAIDAVLALGPGQRTAPIPIGDGNEVIYEVVSKTAGKTVSLEEARGQLELELRQKKEQEQLDSMIQSLIDTHNVKLFPERLTEKPS